MSESSHTPLYIGRQTISSRLKRIWDIIPPFKFFLFMGVLDGLGSILGLIAYVNSDPKSPLLHISIPISNPNSPWNHQRMTFLKTSEQKTKKSTVHLWTVGKRAYPGDRCVLNAMCDRNFGHSLHLLASVGRIRDSLRNDGLSLF